jgi:hypothetical protein
MLPSMSPKTTPKMFASTRRRNRASLGPLTVGQVGGDPEESVDAPLGINHGSHREQDGQPRAVLADVGPLADIVAPAPRPLDEGVEPLNLRAELGR